MRAVRVLVVGAIPVVLIAGVIWLLSFLPTEVVAIGGLMILSLLLLLTLVGILGCLLTDFGTRWPWGAR